MANDDIDKEVVRSIIQGTYKLMKKCDLGEISKSELKTRTIELIKKEVPEDVD